MLDSFYILTAIAVVGIIGFGLGIYSMHNYCTRYIAKHNNDLKEQLKAQLKGKENLAHNK